MCGDRHCQCVANNLWYVACHIMMDDLPAKLLSEFDLSNKMGLTTQQRHVRVENIAAAYSWDNVNLLVYADSS